MYNEGISRIGDLIDTAVNLELVQKAGAWFSYQGQRMQGRDGVKTLLNENQQLMKQLDREVREHMGIEVPKAETNGSPNGHGEAKKEKEKAKTK
jgi:recombination protein RecA